MSTHSHSATTLPSLFRVSQTASDLPLPKSPSKGLTGREGPFKVTKQPGTMNHHTPLHQNHSHINTDTWYCHPECTHTATSNTHSYSPTGSSRRPDTWQRKAGSGGARSHASHLGRATTKSPSDIGVPSCSPSSSSTHTRLSQQPMATVSPSLCHGQLWKTAHGTGVSVQKRTHPQ